MYTVGLYTLGCKVSQYETEAIAEKLSDMGFFVLPFDDVCDAYIINTCTVTSESDRKSRQMIRRAIKTNPSAVIAVIGCYSQNSPDAVSKIEGVSIVLGTDGKMGVADEILKKLNEGNRDVTIRVPSLENARFEEMMIKSAPRTRAYIKIEDGCNSKCTYCAIKTARGPVRSKLPDAVIRECRALTDSGVPEIVLTGIETGAYGKDFGGDYGLADLICLIEAQKCAKQIRLGSLAPELVGRKFAERLKGSGVLTPHFHLSMQSGSDKILASMKRKYNTKMAYDNISAIKEIFPRAEFTTDMMVGFPGEDDADFQASLDFIEKIGFLDVHVFAFSPRKGTEAEGFSGHVPESVKRERSRIMIEHKNRVRDKRLSDIVAKGEPMSVIAETLLDCGMYSAHADNFAEVRFSAKSGHDLRGEFVKVTPVSHKNGIIYAEEI